MTTSISVAMATYNGEAFIKQQLQSIMEQTHLPAELVVTDDTSSDKTLEYIEEFAQTAPFPVRVHRNPARLGYRANFMGAMSLCQSELIALCDQDDVWDPNKLAAAAAAFESPDTVLFYHGAWLIDQAGTRLGSADMHNLPPRNPPLTVHSLFSPFGFSMVFHRSLLQFSYLWSRSVDSNDPKSPAAHDLWLFFLASVFGDIAYDTTRLTDYRQHQNNTYGLDTSWRRRLHRQLRLFRNNASQYARLSHVAAARAEILGESQSRLSGVWLDRALAGERGCQRLAERLGLRAQLYSSASLAERVRLFLRLRRSDAYSTDNGFGLGREVMVKDVTLGVLTKRFLTPLSNKPVDIRPSPSLIVSKMIKRGLTNFRLIPHLLAILISFVRNYWEFRRWRANGKQTLAIALIEHMGDIVAAEPIARLGRKDHPKAGIAWITREPYREIIEDFPAIDKVVTVACMTEWLLLWGAHTTDKTWDLHISERYCPKCGIFFKKPGSAGRLTERTYYNYGNLLAVNCLNADIPIINEAPIIQPDTTSVHTTDNLLLPPKFVVIHCKSNEDRRDWNMDKWKALVEWINSQTEFAVCEIGSHPYVVRHSATNTRDLCGFLAVMETAEVIRRAALFIGIDSGPAHLANATATPGVILLGRYSYFDAYTPYSGGYADGSLADLVRSDGPAANIEVEAVIAKVSKRLGIVRSAGVDVTIPPRL